MPRRTGLMRRAGPYQVISRANGALAVYPEWPDRYNFEEGWGGPGLFSRSGLAYDLQQWLNTLYEDKPPHQFYDLPESWRGIWRLRNDDKNKDGAEVHDCPECGAIHGCAQ